MLARVQRIFRMRAYIEAGFFSLTAIAMPTILDEFRRYMKRARAAATIAVSDAYRRGYLHGLRHHHRVAQFGAQDEHAQWLGFADSPESIELERGYRDGFAGIEPQP